MSAMAFYTFVIAAPIVVVLWAVLTGWLSRRHVKPVDVEMVRGSTEHFHDTPWYRQLNLGALTLTPLWLLANGFWLVSLMYLWISFVVPPLAIVFSIILLFKGTALAWGDGDRWGGDLATFLNEQYFWSFLSLALILAWSVIVLLSLLA